MFDYEQLSGCCGAYVISEFEDIIAYGDGKRKDALEALKDEIDNLPSGKLIVATLIDSQLKDGWKSILEEVGFRRVARWINSNHGNVCNLYVMQNGCNPAPKYKGRGK